MPSREVQSKTAGRLISWREGPNPKIRPGCLENRSDLLWQSQIAGSTNHWGTTRTSSSVRRRIHSFLDAERNSC